MILVKGYQIKVTLDVHPRIWRLVQIPSNITFKELSLILNTAMGWEGYHLSGFRIGKGENQIFVEDYPEDKADGVLNSKKIKIMNIFLRNKKLFTFMILVIIGSMRFYWKKCLRIIKINMLKL